MAQNLGMIAGMLPEPVRKHFLQFCVGELGPDEFEAWVSASPEIENEIGHGPYFDLISADYRGRDTTAVRERCEALLEKHDPGALTRYRVTTILRSMIEDDSAILIGLRKLVALRHQGCELIPIEFVGFDSETDALPTPDRYSLWNPAALAEQLGRAAPYLKTLRLASRELLDHLRKQYPTDV